MANHDAFPGTHARRALSLNLFRVQTTPWLAPFRRTAYSTYVTLQHALAAGDEKTVKKFAVGAQHRKWMEVLRKRDAGKVYVWQGEETGEGKVVSVRAFEQNLGKEEPKFGNRLTVQMLVRFDSKQVCRSAIIL